MIFLQTCVKYSGQLGHFWDQPFGSRGNHGICNGQKNDFDETHFSWILAIESPEFYRILWNSIESLDISANLCDVFRAGQTFLGPTVR